jgi:hypothetical protein
MGCDLHITRAKEQWDSEDAPILLEEWVEFVESDPSLSLDPQSGKGFAVWKGKCRYNDQTWFDWGYGKIFTTNPDTPILRKMLEMAKHFGAQVQGDDCEVYADDSGYPLGYTGPRNSENG